MTTLFAAVLVSIIVAFAQEMVRRNRFVKRIARNTYTAR